jgi:hypothetical protein
MPCTVLYVMVSTKDETRKYVMVEKGAFRL